MVLEFSRNIIVIAVQLSTEKHKFESYYKQKFSGGLSARPSCAAKLFTRDAVFVF